MPAIYRDCPACRKVERRRVGTKNEFEFFDCLACLTLYTGEAPTAGHSEDYDEYYSESNLAVPNFVIERVREIVADFDSYRVSNRLLDIGFGAGTILDVASEFGWQVYGLEVSKPAVYQAQKRGYEIFHGPLLDAKYPEDYFDVITASEILEHLDSPMENLNEIRRLLRPGGLFWATTPSARSLPRRTLGLGWSVASPPEHVQLFSRAGVYRMLEQSGLVPISLKTSGLNPFEIIDHFRMSRISGNGGSNRVSAAYSLNERLTSSPFRKTVKKILNVILGLSGLGDTIRIAATKK